MSECTCTNNSDYCYSCLARQITRELGYEDPEGNVHVERRSGADRRCFVRSAYDRRALLAAEAVKQLLADFENGIHRDDEGNQI